MKSSLLEWKGRCSPGNMETRVDWGLGEAYTKSGMLGVRVLLGHTPQRPEAAADAPERPVWLERMRGAVSGMQRVSAPTAGALPPSSSAALPGISAARQLHTLARRLVR